MARFHLPIRKILGVIAVGIMTYAALMMPLSWMSFKLYIVTLATGPAAFKLVVPFALLCLFGAIAFNTFLMKLKSRWLEFSLYKSRENFSLTPLTFHPVISVGYVAALTVCVVLLAWAEEYIFRTLWTGWLGVFLWGGVVFGLIHMLVGVTVRMSINNGLLGIVLGSIYTVIAPSHGTALTLWIVTIIHATYNYFALTYIMYELHLQEPVSQRLQADTSFARTVRRHLPTMVKWASVKTM